jgi:hypothetical protein
VAVGLVDACLSDASVLECSYKGVGAAAHIFIVLWQGTDTGYLDELGKLCNEPLLLPLDILDQSVHQCCPVPEFTNDSATSERLDGLRRQRDGWDFFNCPCRPFISPLFL